MRIAHRARERGRIDLGAAAVALRRRRAAAACRARPRRVAFVILHADEIVVARRIEPIAVELGALGIAQAVRPDRLVIDHREADAHGQIGPHRLDRRPARPCAPPACSRSARAHPRAARCWPTTNLGTFAARAAAASIAAQATDELRRQDEREQSREVRLVQRCRIADVGREVARGALAEAREQRGGLRVKPAALRREPARRGDSG